MRIVMMGKPGSGKGSQAQRLSRRFGLHHLSSGEILRAEIREGTHLGKEVEQYVLRGEIGPERLIAALVLDHIERKGYSEAYILDGFPRTIYQAEALDARYRPDAAILLEVTDEVILERLTGRLSCPNCGSVYNLLDHPPAEAGICDRCGKGLKRRGDDRREAIIQRLEVFRRDAAPVLDHYSESGRLRVVDGSPPAEDVYADIISIL